MGEKKNWQTAKTVPNRPSILAAEDVLPWRKPSMRRGRTGAIMPRASMSRVTVKKMKVAAARRPLGGWGETAASSPPLRPTSSGSVSSGLGVAPRGGGFSFVSGMLVVAAKKGRFALVYVSFVMDFRGFQR